MKALPGCVDVVALAGHVQRCEAVLGLGRDGSSPLEHHVHHVLVSGPGSAVQRGQPVPGLRLQVGALVQEQSDHVGLPPLGGDVQRGDVVLKSGKNSL